MTDFTANTTAIIKKAVSAGIVGTVIYVVAATSCANPGMPTGGVKDTIPPVVIKMSPDANSRNYGGHTVNLTFDEFVVTDQIAAELVVSPPLPKKPAVKTKGKMVIIDMGDSLRQNVTYSLDFKDAIADNNERNKLKDFRMAFSTGPDFDTLMLGGYVVNAQSLDPAQGVSVLLYDSTDSLESFRKRIPKYLSKTDDEGFYAFSNVADGQYYLFALEDADNSMTYNQSGEKIAFLDSFAIPSTPVMTGTLDMDSAAYYALRDSLRTDSVRHNSRLLSLSQTLVDSINPLLPEMVIPGGIDVDPNRPGRQAGTTRMMPYYLLLFEEESNEQYLDKYTREPFNKLTFYFTNHLSDSFDVELLTPQTDRAWHVNEFSVTRDTVTVWITDSLIAKKDTMSLVLRYEVPDTLGNLVIKPDTLRLYLKKADEKDRRRRNRDKDEEEEEDVIQPFAFRVNAKSQFDQYSALEIVAPELLQSFDFNMIKVYELVDTLKNELKIAPEQDARLSRRYYIRYPWKFKSQYEVVIDSAAAKTYMGVPSGKLSQKFDIQEEEYYGKIIFTLQNVKEQCLLQLLDNTEKENVLSQTVITGDGTVEMPFIKPEKYRVKIVIDKNHNGKWDTGSLDGKIQPEGIAYYPKVLKIKSNFDIHETWRLPDGMTKKEVIDDEQQKEDAKRKNAPSSAPRGNVSMPIRSPIGGF
ncbi:MAG: Ig-like domain-containing protein [Bacteroidales bacterium]|jgi:hypothetical protein|nr:Ig-like domain-containing protein [Bacteroidales bacterium]